MVATEPRSTLACVLALLRQSEWPASAHSALSRVASRGAGIVERRCTADNAQAALRTRRGSLKACRHGGRDCASSSFNEEQPLQINNRIDLIFSLSTKLIDRAMLHWCDVETGERAATVLRPALRPARLGTTSRRQQQQQQQQQRFHSEMNGDRTIQNNRC